MSIGTMLSEEGVAQLLAEAVEHLEVGDLEQARLTLTERLNFERLMRPIGDPTRVRVFIDPAADFGVERVHETGEQIRQCLRAVNTNNPQVALVFAKAAAARWAKP